MRFTPKKRGLDLRRQRVVLVVPGDPAYVPSIDKIAGDLKREGCRQVRVLTGFDRDTDLGGAQPVALGNCVDNGLIRSLYFRARDVTDRAWPGPGGSAVRCVTSAGHGSGDALVLSVSDPADAMRVAGIIGQELKDHGLDLPWLHRVELGQWKQQYLDQIGELLPSADAPLDALGGGSGDWDYMMAIGRVGMLAVKTADPNLILRFVSELLRFIRVRFSERDLEDPVQIHGFLRNLLRPFAMLEHHPVVSDSQRLNALEGLLALYRSSEGVANSHLIDECRYTRIRQNHGTRTAVDVFDGGLYFRREHGLEEGREWMALAARFFEPQMISSKPVCDSWGHQWAGSLCNTAEYALLAGRFDYFKSRHFIDGADRALMAHSNLENGPLLYLLLAAAVTGDDGYRALCYRERSPLFGSPSGSEGAVSKGVTESDDYLAPRALSLIGGDEFGRSWVMGAPVGYPERLLGVKVAPVAQLFYESIEDFEPYAPEGVYLRDVPIGSTFDKISFRSGWGASNTYLLLDGISGGSHSYQDANCIVRFSSMGKSWLGGPRYGSWTTGTVREQNGVSVSCDGEGAGCESRYARLIQAEEIAGVGLIRTCLEFPGVALWYRQIVIHPRAWVLVCDEIVALKTGFFSIQAQWNLLGEVERTGDGSAGVRSVQDSACLTLRQVGSACSWLAPVHAAGQEVGTRWNLRRTRQLGMGESHLIGTLLHVSNSPGSAAPALGVEGPGLSVEVVGRAAVKIRFDRERDQMEVAGESIRLPAGGELQGFRVSGPRDPCRQFEPLWCSDLESPVSTVIACDDDCVVGTEAGSLFRIDSDGRVAQRFGSGEAVSAIAFTPDGGLLTGHADGTLCCFDPKGVRLWRYTIVWQPMNWDNWTRGHCAVLSLAAGDLDGSYSFIAGCADRHLYAFKEDGELLWRSPCQWGPAAHVAIAGTGPGGANQIIVGMARPAIHGACRVFDADGKCVRSLERPDIVSWSIPSWVTGLRAVDLNDDGRVEVVVGLDTNHRQLIVYRAGGEILWEADPGSAVTCLEAAHGRLYTGSDGGWVHCFDPDGNCRWSRSLVRPLLGLAPVSPDRTLAVTDDGTVHVIEDAALHGTGASVTSPQMTAYMPGHGLLVGRVGSHHLALYR